MIVLIKNKSKINQSGSSYTSGQSQKHYQGDYLGFFYPNNYTLEKINTTDGRVLENWKVTENNTLPTIITLTLINSSKDLVDFEPIKERRRNPIQYLEEIGRKQEIRGILFRTIDRKERMIFFSNKTQILIVDFIAKTTDPTKEIEFQTFVDNIDWD